MHLVCVANAPRVPCRQGKLDLQCTNFWISGPAGGTLKGAAGENFLDFVGLNTGKQGNIYFQ